MRLTAEIRTKPGTNASRKLRKQAKVPAVLYGSGESRPIALALADVDSLIASHQRTVEIELDGQVEQTLIQDVQFDTFGSEVLHLDFKRVSLDDVVQVIVALRFSGTPVGLLSGGIVDYHLVDLEIECKAGEIPTEIVVPIEQLEVGDILQINEVPLPEGVKALGHSKAPVVQCVMSKKLKLDEDEAETDETALAEGEAPAAAEGGEES